jgi:hypothetical protein
VQHVKNGHDRDELIDWEIDVIRTILDALTVWRPDPRHGHQVDLQNVEDVIFQLRDTYPSIGHWPKKTRGEAERKPTVTFDHWNSALTIQRMRSRRMNVKDEHWARDFQVDIYRNARKNFYNGLVTLPDTPSITSPDPSDPGAVHELERIEFIDAINVDHPEGGGKDSADAVVRVIQHATEHNRAGFAYGTAYGHRSGYASLAPVVPSSQPIVDRARPTGIPQHVEDREQLDRAERPFGELSPAEGTVNRRKLAFGSIQQRRRGLANLVTR